MGERPGSGHGMSRQQAPSIGVTPTAEQLERFLAESTGAGHRLVVGALIADEAGRLYVQKRSEQRALFPGCWDIVGGHVGDGEDLLGALAREVEEETGWQLAEVGPVVEILDWSAGDGVSRREIDVLARVTGDLAHPHLELGKHSEGRWLERRELEVLREERLPGDEWVHDTVARAFELLPAWTAAGLRLWRTSPPGGHEE